MKDSSPAFAVILAAHILVVVSAGRAEPQSPAEVPVPGERESLPSDIPGGFMIIEGDIIVPIGFYESRATYQTNPWTGGIVPYAFDANVNGTNQSRTLEAMAEWEARADVTFVPRTGEANYVHIQGGNGNSSFVGMIGGRQTITMYNWSWKYIIAHELGHALSFWHEQSRPDRDSFIQVNFGNIIPGREGNFSIHNSAGTTGPYDFDSVMHYGQCGFADCPCPSSCTTITVLPPNESWQSRIGQRNHLSEWDGRGMADVYGFSGPDCNGNFVRDGYDIATGTSIDCNGNDTPDECDRDANGNSVPDECELPGDFNGDGFLELDDYALFHPCVDGPNVPIAVPCAMADTDFDDDSDLLDLANVQWAFTGAP